MTALFYVHVVRYSRDVGAMEGFFRAVGLAAHGGEAVAFLGDTGRVDVRPPTGDFHAGETYVNLLTESLEDAVDAANNAGADYLVWEEDDVHYAAIEGRSGEWIRVEEGIAGSHTDHELGWGVSAIRPSPDFARDRDFFADFGFSPGAGANEWFESLLGPMNAGTIGLHHAAEDVPRFSAQEDPRNRLPYADIGLTTSDDLEETAQRLTEAGYPAGVVTAGTLTKVHVQDPDGIEIEIHPA